MRGVISVYQTNTRNGLIRGDNRINYTFNRSIWLSQKEPRAGMIVEFDIENNFANNILLAPPIVPPKSRGTAIFLTLFFGWFGAHKFYLGQKAQGWLYLVFFWTLLPLVMSLFDLLGLLFTSSHRFDDRFN